MRKILLVSELPLKSYDGGKSAKKAFGLLVLLTAAFIGPLVISAYTGGSDIFMRLIFDKISILMAALTAYLCVKVYLAQQKWAWLDYYSVSSILARVKQDGFACIVVNDSVAPSFTPRESAFVDAAFDGLTPAEQAMRKNTLHSLRCCLWNTDPAVCGGMLLFLGGTALMAVGQAMPEGTAQFVLHLCGVFACLSGWLKWFIAWYNLL